MATIENTGDLREFLSKTIVSVANGTCDVSKAREIGKLSSQINESFYAEVKIASTQKDLGREIEGFGLLNLGNK